MTTKKTLELEDEVGGSAAPAEADQGGEPDASDAAGAFDDTPTSADYSTAFSPRNVAVGLAIVAGLVAFVASRRRRKHSGREDG